jgi:hypothetical protein
MGQLINLDTLAPDRPTVRIDGQSYQLKRAEDFGLQDWAEFQLLQSKAGYLEAIATGQENPEDVADLSKMLRTMVRMVVLDAPDEVLERLNDAQRLALLQAFVGATKAPASPRNRAARRKIGARKRPVSRGSTNPPTR